ncbi:MAG TPA: DedA family protein [Gemmatimonadales bacterium]|nr:DedA family protein [Gemmatimonadales bacterium]
MIQWLLDTLRALGYPGIIVLMAIESSVLPVPAEAVIPPAGYWAAKGVMDPVLVTLCAVIGSVIGSLASYGLARWLGRGFIERYGKYVLVSARSLERTDNFFARHGEISVLVGRLLPVARHLISIPAGIARMPLPRFVLYTAAGATVWCAVLTVIGYVLGKNEAVLRNEDVHRYVGQAIVIALLLVALGIVVYVVRVRGRPARSPE